VVFALPWDALNDRVGVILTLLLTAVAFKLVITDSIPKVGYSTLIDNFVLGNMIFLFSTVLLCTAGFLIEDSFGHIVEGCGLNPICHTSIYFYEMVTAYDTSVNFLIFCASLSLFSLINFYWISTVLRRERIHPHLHPLQKQKNRNWYACAFSNPHFLPEPERHNKS
jgi:hypothetical protein